jgi:hypothetical protein
MFGLFKGNQTEKEEVVKKVTTLSILEGLDNPWRVADNRYTEKLAYVIQVFRLDISHWEDLDACSKKVLGVSSEEFHRVLKEVFNGEDDHYGGIMFRKREDAERAIEEFRPYYDSYHTPRAIADRLSFYDEGSYPPYFGEYVKKYVKEESES